MQNAGGVATVAAMRRPEAMESRMDQERYDRGMKLRRQVLGDAYVDRAMASADAFTHDLQEMATEIGWGGSWGRGGLELKQRSMINLAMLAALGRPHEFEVHMNGALNNGCTLAEIREVLHQVAVYCGVPAAIDSFRTARKVLDERGIKPDEDPSLARR